MGLKERREREKEQLRQLILDAANRLFLELGFEKTTMRKIAAEIEYNPATIYFYYKNKEEIFFALQKTAFEAFREAIATAASTKDPAERMTKMGRSYIRFALENPSYYDLMFIMREPMKSMDEDAHWRIGEQTFNMLEKTVQDCMDAGLIPHSDVKGMALMIWSAMHGIVSLPICNRLTMFDDADKYFLIREAFNAFDKMLLGKFQSNLNT